MDIETFDALDAATASAVLRDCARVSSWVDALVASRPHGSVRTLRARAAALAADWGEGEVAEALADHPRIGERHDGQGRSAAFSQDEQSGVDRSSDTLVRLAAGNRRYERRFGRIFLVRAAGRTSEEILEQLEQRLRNDPATEAGVTVDQLRQITLLRLEGVIS